MIDKLNRILTRQKEILAELSSPETASDAARMTALMKDVALSEIRHTTRITTSYEPEKEMELPTWI